MAELVWLLCLILLPEVILCFENLSRKNSTHVSQSSTYLDRNATFAIDGGYETKEQYCAHTALGHDKAWFQVDLGTAYNLKSIKITYRDEGRNAWRPYRFRQYYLDVANASADDSSTTERFRCYKDNTTSPNIPGNIVEVICKQIARYVIVETLYDAPEDNKTGAVLEICEIDVIGCQLYSYGETCQSCGSCEYCDIENGCVCPKGFYGNNCKRRCSGNCIDDDCDITSGKCKKGCKTGFYDTMCNSSCNANCVNNTCTQQDGTCNLGCNDGFHGLFCRSTCNSNCRNRICDQSSGHCIDCRKGHYGVMCSSSCSAGCTSGECDINGNCIDGCNEGFYGSQCRGECGRGCSTSCDSYGYCSCLTGWEQYFCKSCAPSYFGQNCTEKCSSNCIHSECHSETGVCISCPHKKFGQQCQYRCDNCDGYYGCKSTTGLCIGYCVYGFWGGFCNKTCGKCGDKRCFKDSGKCRTRYCHTGYYGEKCDRQCSLQCKNNHCYKQSGECDWQGCKAGYFGGKCDQECSANCVGRECDRISGRCPDGCIAGFYGPNCTTPCSTNCFNKTCYQENGICLHGCRPSFYGDQCDKECLRSGFCLYDTCYRANGTCNQGCIQGWQDPNCSECSATYYGTKCSKRCQNCVDGLCFRQNGSCIKGCIGDCQVDAQTGSAGPDLVIIGAGVGGSVLLLILIVVLVLRIRRRKENVPRKKILYQKKSQHGSENPSCNDLQNVTIMREDDTEEPYEENPEEAVYYNDLSAARDIAISDLPSIIKNKEANKNEGFIKEFKMLPYGERFDCHTAKLEKNMPKNRFKTTFPYDHSRVLLDTNAGFTSDYINANHIGNMEGHREFIACQGPLATTLVDHWRMIWQENIEYIVMLTNLIEGPRVKCHQYWPDNDKELNVDPFFITSVEESVYACFVIRRMTVSKKGITGSRTVVQFHYTRWPDHGTPNPLDLVVFHRHFRHKITPSQHPILVHCSAGIGRTGTFIALDVLSRYAEERGKVNVVEYVKAMRKDRMTMIQNADQYAFLYHALYEIFRRKWNFVRREEFLKLYGDMERPETRKQMTDEFNELTSLRLKYSDNDFKSGKEYAKLNAIQSVLPVERYLVYLTSNVHGREQYYNAVAVSSFGRAEEFISAQHPVPGATIDLVRLLVDQESSFLISLNPLTGDKELKRLVEEDIIKLDYYDITREKQTTLSNEIRKTSLQIKQIKEDNEIHKVHIFECMNWSTKDRVPLEPSTLNILIKQFKLDRQPENGGHTTVISKDGATCCGVFIAIYNAIEQLQQDDEVDLFTIVQQLQCRRPEMISTKEEYEFCFRVVHDYLSSDNVYANA